MTLSHLTEGELSNRYLCEAHFESCFIKRSTGFRPVLDKTAIPKNSSIEDELSSPDHLKVKTPTKVYKRKATFDLDKENIEPVDPEFGFHLPGKPKRRRLLLEEPERVKKMQQTVTYCTKKLKSNTFSLQKLKKKLKSNTFSLQKEKA